MSVLDWLRTKHAVHFSRHALERMKERVLTPNEVFQIIDEHLDNFPKPGEYRFTSVRAGMRLTVIVAIAKNHIGVKTVYEMKLRP